MPHINELYDYTIAVFIVHDGRVLLVQHPRYNKWLPIGGHIELDEDPEQALYREIIEETGLQVSILSSKPAVTSPETKFIIQPNYVDVHEANMPHKHICFIYFGKAANDQAVLSDEHLAMRWVALEDLGSDEYALTPAIQFYAREAIALAK